MIGRALCGIAVLLTCLGCESKETRVARPAPLTYTRPAPVNEVQDAAFWIHPTDPQRSLVLVTNEHRGLEVHDMNGVLLKHLDESCEPQYVDVVYDVATASGVRDLVLASCQGEFSVGVKAWGVDPVKAKLVELQGQSVLPVLDNSAPLGLFGYRGTDGKAFIFVTTGEGAVEQHEVVPAAEGEGVALKLRRSLKVAGKSKGGCADVEHGVVFIEEDKVGIWAFPLDPDSPAEGKLVIRAGENGLLPNVRGPALYRAEAGNGYLLVAGQGKKGDAAVVHVYDRKPPYRHLARIEPAAGAYGLAEHSSGLAVTSAETSARFSGGVFALNDQQTDNGSEDFKLYSWKEIAESAGLDWQHGTSPHDHLGSAR